MTIVVQGPNGYLSPIDYRAGPSVPTWNLVVAHLHGAPQVLGPEETYATLSATVDHCESGRPEPFRMNMVEECARGIAPAVTGFRLVPTRWWAGPPGGCGIEVLGTPPGGCWTHRQQI